MLIIKTFLTRQKISKFTKSDKENELSNQAGSLSGISKRCNQIIGNWTKNIIFWDKKLRKNSMTIATGWKLGLVENVVIFFLDECEWRHDQVWLLQNFFKPNVYSNIVGIFQYFKNNI